MILTTSQYNKFQILQKEIEILFDDIKNNKPSDVNTLDSVTDYSCELFGVKKKDLKSPSRTAELKKARGYICYFCKKELNMTYRQIGTYFNRTHASIINVINVFEKDLLYLPEKSSNYENFKFELL
tara:strand:+ start:244 stop:621 length:378 start_codon:yes stop_codon:yes gene_type:complete